MVGPTDSMGSGSHALYGYAKNDRDSVSLGQRINLNLGLCDSGGAVAGGTGDYTSSGGLLAVDPELLPDQQAL